MSSSWTSGVTPSPMATNRVRSPLADGLPYVCVPAGTRNHFAIDIGIAHDDVVGALDAFIDGAERRIDPGAGQRPLFRDRLDGLVRRDGAVPGLSRREDANGDRDAA